MKLCIELLRERKNRTYSSADVVTGVCSLDISSRLSISELKLSIQGCLEPGDSGVMGAEQAPMPLLFKVFDTSKALFPTPPMCASTRYTFAPGLYKYTFGLDFTLLVRCMNAKLADLSIPKRFRGATRASFRIKATAKGVGLLRRRLLSRVYITLVQLEMPNIPPMLYKGRRLECQAYQVVPFHVLGLSQGSPERVEGGEGGYEALPMYDPAVVLGAILEDDESDLGRTTLHPDGPLPLSFWVVLPTDCSKAADLWLRSIRISLIDPSISTNGDQQLIYPSEIILCHTKVKLRPRSEYAEFHAGAVQVDPSLWEDCVVPRKATSWPQNKEYLLRVLCELSVRDSSNHVFTAVVVPVVIGDIWNPPPTYSLGTDTSAGLCESGQSGLHSTADVLAFV
ncbi:hypothetical protein F4680DRAFT_124439 [Xylaria scruposa]|nr:hypothetical protein F4680DRAFT_124439 [Xylaria scruposa]